MKNKVQEKKKQKMATILQILIHIHIKNVEENIHVTDPVPIINIQAIIIIKVILVIAVM